MSDPRRVPILSEKGRDLRHPGGNAREHISTLRDLVCIRDGPSFLLEARDGLSAAIAERAGFLGLWASGLSIASALGYRDAHEASWTQVVDVVERIVDATNIPVLVDGDSGFGNFNNARLAARKLEQRGASGVCLEDKGFPKMNSFVGDRHPLADIDEFSGRSLARSCSRSRIARPTRPCHRRHFTALMSLSMVGSASKGPDRDRTM